MVNIAIVNDSDEIHSNQSTSGKSTVFIYVVAILSALGGFLFGYDTGVVSGALVFVKDEFHLNHWWQEVIVSATILSAWIFSIAAGYCTEHWGRKLSIIIASFLCTLGSIIMAIAYSVWILLLGRFVVGAGVGLASMAVPMYIAEVAPSYIRGKLVTINNCFITGGQFIAAIVAGIFSFNAETGWRYMLGLAAIPSALQFVGFMFMPESPRWLIHHQKFDDAFKVLKTIRHKTIDVREEFKMVKDKSAATQDDDEKKGLAVLKKIISDPSLRHALLVGCLLQIVQQLAGINTVMYYSVTIIQMSGVQDKTIAVWLAVGTAFINFICTFIGLYLVEKIGRRLLTLSSLAGVVLSLIILAVGFQLVHIFSPAIGWHDESAANYSCYQVNTCSSCTRSSECGYCYFNLNISMVKFNEYDKFDQLNGTCLPFDFGSKEYAKNGSSYCTEGNNHSTIWSPDMCPSKFSMITLFGLMLYLFFFAPGMGPMPWTINSEIYPLWARSVCFSIATSFNWFFNLFVSLTFLSLTQLITKFGAFYLYALFAFVGWIFFYFKLPETKQHILH